ncbi:hypothetical protein N431DRAFT_441798 [Stipitochalara longipes BDJ]|nr:hypothetical protein N431DRAFT_441798 [Stipitochalara longipes BDJ]
MKTGLFLLPSLAAVCYSAALPKEDNGNVLKRDSDDYTLTVFVTASPPKATAVKSVTQQNQGGVYVTITKTLTTKPVTIKKTTSKKATTTVRYGNTPVVTVYRTVTTAKPVTVYITTDDGDDNSDDNGDDNGDDSGDDGSGNNNGNRKRQNRKRQVWLDPFTTTDYYTPDTPQPTGGDWGDWSGWGAASTTTDYEDDEPVRTTTVWETPRRHHTTTVWTPRQTFWAKREAVPQTDEFEIGDTSSEQTYGGEIEQPAEIETLDVEETDNKKRNPSPQILFTVTDDLNYPIETSTYHPVSTRRPSWTTDRDPIETETYRPFSTRRPSRTTTDRFGPYGSWYLTATGRHSVSTYHTYSTYNPYSSVATYSPYSPVSTDVPDPDNDDPDSQDPDDEDPNDDSKVTKRQITFGNGGNDDDNTIYNGDDNSDDITIQTFAPVTNNEDDGETNDTDSEDSDSELETDNKKRNLAPAFKKRAIKNGDSACAPQSVTVTVTSYIEKPTGLVEVSISRTIIQAGVSVLLTSSSSSSSVAQTTFATSTKARVEIRG